MSVEAWITAVVVVAMLVALAFELMPPAATVLTATVALLFLGVIDETEAFSGFSNPAPLTVAALYVLAFAADKTGLLGPLVNRLLGRGDSIRTGEVARLAVPTAGLSAFVNNTPLVAMLIGQVSTWCNQRGLAPSRILMPISYAAILGGTLTVIGTSTNLVASGLLQESGRAPIGMFEITAVSGPAALLGVACVVLLVPLLLPRRRGAVEEYSDEINEFTALMEVIEGGPYDGVTVADAGLRDLKGVYLIEVIRDGQITDTVAPEFELRGGDRITFTGGTEPIVEFQRTPGLRSAESRHMLEIDSPEHTFYEAVIGSGSRLVGRTLAGIGFRGTYQAAVLAIHRAGGRIDRGLGRISLEAGDTLILLAGPDFQRRSRRNKDFLVIARLGGPPPSSTRRAPLVALVAVAIVGLAAFDVFPILQLALAGAGILIATRTITFSEAGQAIDFGVILLIAAAFGVGAAIEVTGLAERIAEGLLDLFGDFGNLGILFGIALATLILTEVITNNAAVIVIFPIALAVSTAAGLDPRIVTIMVAVIASASFLTPMGYQTNTMVYGPGGYRFSDYLRAGFPLTIVVLGAVTLVSWQLA